MCHFKSYVVTSDGQVFFTDNDSHSEILRKLGFYDERGLVATDKELGKDYVCIECRPEHNFAVSFDAPTIRPDWFTVEMFDKISDLTRQIKNISAATKEVNYRIDWSYINHMVDAYRSKVGKKYEKKIASLEAKQEKLSDKRDELEQKYDDAIDATWAKEQEYQDIIDGYENEVSLKVDDFERDLTEKTRQKILSKKPDVTDIASIEGYLA